MNNLKSKIKYILGVIVLVLGLLGGYGTISDGDAEKQSSQEPESFVMVEGEDGSESELEAEQSDTSQETTEQNEESHFGVTEDGTYTSKEEVAEYLYVFGHLPDNFITKAEAKKLGWVSSEGNLGDVAPGMSIGGDYFGNYEEILPEKDGRDYYECDIDSDGGYRGAKRIIYSNDGLIYYTEDHYETFELLYGEEG
ncbi:MAG: ribonuclease domain-containing protein [Ruminococcus sp.]|nr:ribonuclease domain-containing protein [Ruminococcus sp.]